MTNHVVIKHFKDKEDNSYYNAVDEFYPRPDLEVSDERIAFLKENGYIKQVKAATVPLDDYKVDELKALADEKGIGYKSDVKKAELIDLLRE